MDLAYWGFSRWPFQRHRSDSPDVGAAYEEAQARLLFLVDEFRRCGLLTGAAGTGKTRLFRHVRSYALRHGRACLEVDAAGLNADSLAWRIADQNLVAGGGDGMTTPTQCWSLIQRYFAGLALMKQPLVALFDHWDQADSSCARAIRRLMNLADSQGAKLTVLLASRVPRVAAEIWDEIELLIELDGWTANETAAFIEQSLQTCGATSAVFTIDALTAIHEASHGVPREVLRICDLALLAAMNNDRRKIDAAIIADAIEELIPSRRLATERPAFVGHAARR